MAGYDLKQALQRLQRKRQNFAFFRGEEGDQIFVSARPPSSKQLEEIEKETGEGKRILKGVCFMEESGLVFATRNAAAPAWEKMLTKVLQERKCAQFLPISLRQLAPGEGEEASGDEPEADETPIQRDAAQVEWEQLKSTLMPQLRQAIADPATKEKVTKVVLAAQASEKAGNYPAAIAVFQRLAGVLQISLTPPAPVQAPQPGQLQAAMNKLAPVFQVAVAGHPGRKRELLQPIVEFQRQLKAGELEEARETLRQVGRLLKSAV